MSNQEIMWIISGYAKTGTYSDSVTAADEVTALKEGKKKIKKWLPPYARVTKWSVRKY